MRKKRIITSIVVVICVLVGVFFVMRFGVLGKIYDTVSRYVVQDKAEPEEEGPEELRYETVHDKNGNEYVVEMKKIIGFDEEGNKVEIWEDAAEPIIIYENTYLGRIEKIDDNKIYFMVGREIEVKGEGSAVMYITFSNVEDYQVVFDIDSYDLESDPDSYDSGFGPHYFYDSLKVSSEDICSGSERFHSAGELEFLVGKYLMVQDTMFEDYYIGDRHKILYFQPMSFIKSLFPSLFF